MKSLTNWIVVAVAVVSLAACGDKKTAAAPPIVSPPVTTELYGTTTGNGTLGASILVKLDPVTGALLKTIGTTSYYVNGLVYDETNGKLYGTTTAQDPSFPRGLIEINMTTGVSTTIGISGLSSVITPAVNSAGQMFGWNRQTSYDLITINKTTGAATVVGDSGLSTYGHGLAFDNADNLYLVNGDGSVYLMSTTTGSGTLQGTIGVKAHHGDFHPVTGLYWGIDNTYESGVAARNLLVVSTATPTIVGTHATVNELHAIAFRDTTTTQMFGTTTGVASLGTSTLVRLSPKTGALISTIGSVGYYVNGLVYDEVGGKLYGTTSNNDPVFPRGLIEINMATGASTTIGATGLVPPVMTPAVNSAGQMYGWTGYHASGIDNYDLVTINKSTGAATVVGDSGTSFWGHGLAFNNADNLYIVNGNGSIYLVSTATGSVTLQGTIGVQAHHGAFHPVTGLYWGIDNVWDSGIVPRNLRVVSMATPTIVGTHATVDQLHAITFKK